MGPRVPASRTIRRCTQQAARERYRGKGPAEANPNAFWIRASNPHNEYVMQLVGGGVTALALFLGWLGLTFRQAARARRPVSGLLAGMGLAFTAGCLFNSLLMDFVEGHLYIALLAWMLAENRYPAPEPRPVERILVVATRQIGDVLLTTPLIQAARQRWPQARIDVLGFPGTMGMLRGNPDLNRLLESPARPGWRGLLAQAAAALAPLRPRTGDRPRRPRPPDRVAGGAAAQRDRARGAGAATG